MVFWIASKIVALIIAWVATIPAPQQVVEVAPVWTPPIPTAVPTSVYTPIPESIPTAQITQAMNIQDSLDDWISQSNWPPQTWSTVRRIVLCESGGVVGIDTNPPHVGLMQANVNFWGRVPKDPIAELNQGYYIYTQQGFSAWECY